jgi:hypothetical protein
LGAIPGRATHDPRVDHSAGARLKVSSQAPRLPELPQPEPVEESFDAVRREPFEHTVVSIAVTYFLRK